MSFKTAGDNIAGATAGAGSSWNCRTARAEYSKLFESEPCRSPYPNWLAVPSVTALVQPIVVVVPGTKVAGIEHEVMVASAGTFPSLGILTANAGENLKFREPPSFCTRPTCNCGERSYTVPKYAWSCVVSMMLGRMLDPKRTQSCPPSK